MNEKSKESWSIKRIKEKSAQIFRLRLSVEKLQKRETELSDLVEKQGNIINKLKTDLNILSHKNNQSLKFIEDNLANLSDKVLDMSWVNKGAISTNSVASTEDIHTSRKQVFAENHSLDRFYKKFEDIFRGDEKLIESRLEKYLVYFKNTKLDFKKRPAVDIGCGRGEMLRILKEANINSIGVDLNGTMVEHNKTKGFDAIQGDAIKFLKEKSSSSFSAITGFHIIEHIPFEDLVTLFEESFRTLCRGGFVIFETPNPENINVATISFRMDPSHLNPLPPALVELLAKFVGFRDVKILRLHPAEPGSSPTNKDTRAATYNPANVNEVIDRFNTAQDFAVVATK